MINSIKEKSYLDKLLKRCGCKLEFHLSIEQNFSIIELEEKLEVSYPWSEIKIVQERLKNKLDIFLHVEKCGEGSFIFSWNDVSCKCYGFKYIPLEEIFPKETLLKKIRNEIWK